MKTKEWELKLERTLQAVLQPVGARPAFVTDLKLRLMNARPEKARFSIQLPSLDRGMKFALVILGVASGILVLVNGVRALITLLAALGLIQGIKKEKEIRAGATPTLQPTG